MSRVDRVQQSGTDKCSKKQSVAERARREEFRRGVRSAE